MLCNYTKTLIRFFEADTTFDYVAKIDGILSTVNAESVNKSNQANEFFEDKD